MRVIVQAMRNILRLILFTYRTLIAKTFLSQISEWFVCSQTWEIKTLGRKKNIYCYSLEMDFIEIDFMRITFVKTNELHVKCNVKCSNIQHTIN